MKKIQCLVLIFVKFLLVGCGDATLSQNKELEEYRKEKPTVVVFSMDGFRWDYTDKVATPNFDRLAKMGVKAASLKPSFPSKTFPNHYTIATGLYPGNNGIVNNSFYHEEKQEMYAIRNRTAVSDGTYYKGEPIWNTAEKQGLKSASFFWVGSEADVQGKRPSYWKSYDGNVGWKARVDTVISWLRKPILERPNLVLCYVDEPDHAGHRYGPDSDQVKVEIRKLDELLGYFLDELDGLPNRSKLSFIVTTDHGMLEVSGDRNVSLSEYINDEQLDRKVLGSPVVFLYPKQGELEQIYSKLKTVKHISVYKKGECPGSWHYNKAENVGDLIVVADSAYSVIWEKGKLNYHGGAHGYDPNIIDMHGIFYAEGPLLKKGFVHPTFENVDIYPLLAKLLGIQAAKSDGKLTRIEGMLIPKK